MTPDEFNRWWSDAKMRWPSLESWLAKNFATQDRQVEFLKTWRAVLVDVSFADASEVNRKMQAGDLPWVGEYDSDKERLPQHVRRLAKQLAFESRDKDQHREPDRKPSTFPAGKILRRILELRDAGTSPEEAKRIALEEFPIGPANYEPRYECHLCQDQGRVTVASNHAIQAILEGTFDRCHHRIGAMRCNCRRGMVLRPKAPLETFDQDKDFRIVDFTWGSAEVDRLSAWAEDRKAKLAANRMADYVWTPDASRHREFAP